MLVEGKGDDAMQELQAIAQDRAVSGSDLAAVEEALESVCNGKVSLQYIQFHLLFHFLH